MFYSFHSQVPKPKRKDRIFGLFLLIMKAFCALEFLISRVALDAELAGAAGYLANLFCRISGIRPDIRPDIWLNS